MENKNTELKAGDFLNGKLLVDNEMLYKLTIEPVKANDGTMIYSYADHIIDTRLVTDMTLLFAVFGPRSKIENWNTENVKSMDFMFYDTDKLDQDLSKWSLKSLESATSMFLNANVLKTNTSRFQK